MGIPSPTGVIIMKVGDLVYYQAQGFNCGFHNECDGPALFISFKKRCANDKNNTVEILRTSMGNVEEAYEGQVGLLDSWEGRNV